MSYPTPPIKLQTDNPLLYMRTPHPDQSDASGLSSYFTSYKHDVQESGDTSPEHYAARITEWLAASERGEYHCFVVVLTDPDNDTDKIIGVASYNGFATSTNENGASCRVADIGMGIESAQKRKGYGAAIVKALIDRAFDAFGADVVEADTLLTNTAYQALMRKLNLEQFARKRIEDGEEEYLYSFTKAQWQDLQQQ